MDCVRQIFLCRFIIAKIKTTHGITISKKNLNLFFERAALVSGNFHFEDNMLKSIFVEKNFEEYIIKDREKFKPYIPTEEEIF